MGDGQARVLVERARALGVTAFETATSYGEGAMERLLGDVLGADAGSIVITKLGTDLSSLPPRKRFDVAYLQRALDEAQERLRRPTLDVVLLHNPSKAALDDPALGQWLDGCIAQGRLRTWGVSVGNAEIGRAALGMGAKVLQFAFNALHTSELDALGAEATSRGVGLLARSVLAHGLLCGLWPRSKRFGPGDHRAERWSAEELERRIQQLDALRPAVGTGADSLRAVALRFVLEHEALSGVVVGPRTPLQLDQLVREAGKGPPYLSAETMRELEGRLRAVGARE